MNTRQKTIRYSLAGMSLASFLGVFGYIASTDHTKPIEASAAPSTDVRPNQPPPVANSNSGQDTPIYGRHERRFRLPDDSSQQAPSQSSGSTQPYGGYSGAQSSGSTQQRQTQPQTPSQPQTHTQSRAS